MRRHAATQRPSLLRDQAALAAMEFVLVVPIILSLLFGMFEFTRLLDIERKLNRTANELGYLLAQTTPPTVSTAKLNEYIGQMETLLSPHAFAGNGSVIFTSVHRNAGPQPLLYWGYNPFDGISRVDLTNEDILPQFTIAANENVVVVEVLYNFRALFPLLSANLFGLTDRTLYRSAVFVPLKGDLTARGP